MLWGARTGCLASRRAGVARFVQKLDLPTMAEKEVSNGVLSERQNKAIIIIIIIVIVIVIIITDTAAHTGRAPKKISQPGGFTQRATKELLQKCECGWWMVV